MKIYDLSKIPGIGNEPPKEPDYEAIFKSGYKDGYEEGYTAVPCYENMYLTIEVQYDGEIDIPEGNDRYYRINGGEWLPSNGVVDVSYGDKIELKALGSAPYYFMERLASACTVYGNIMSLFYGDDFQGKLTFPVTGQTWPDQDSNCSQIFDGCLGLTDASNLILPATALTDNCYNGMFWGCRNLQHGPKILPAMTLSRNCYQHMFSGCYKLLNAPELPAPVLTEYCYYSMFANCYVLDYIKCLATDISANDCTSYWSSNLPRNGTFVKAQEMNDWGSVVWGIPYDWTVVDAE